MSDVTMETVIRVKQRGAVLSEYTVRAGEWVDAVHFHPDGSVRPTGRIPIDTFRELVALVRDGKAPV